MEARGVPWLLVTNLNNIAYLTGFRGSAGVALFGPAEAILWVDPRYTLQAREQAREVEVIEEKRGLLRAAARWLRRSKARRVGFEDANLSCADYDQLVRETFSRAMLRPAGGLVEELRAVKDPEEIARIRAAGHVTAKVFEEEVLGQVRPGVRELDLATEIEYRLRKRGAEGVGFETIVASGPQGASPHARASSKLLQENELVIIDLGGRIRGYAADMTRTVYLGEPRRRVCRLYNAVVEAQQRAVDALRVGTRTGDVDAAARCVLAARGLAKLFTHSTGHGVGLEVHERPRLARGEKTRLKAGCVVTVEPGVYLEGFGGIRVEDTVLVGLDGPEILTPASKDRWIIT
jgi:Xaa-Pro aminopeptidase